MDLLLPNRIDGSKPAILHGVNQMTVIGANGAGKSRFCRRLLEQYGDKAFRLSALKAKLPIAHTESNLSSINKLFMEAQASLGMNTTVNATNELEQLLFLLIHEECVELMLHKLRVKRGEQVPMPHTKIDIVREEWERIFPGNKMLQEGGRIFFSNDASPDIFSQLRLSDGELSSLYYIAGILFAKPNAVVLVDNPTLFIHQSIMQTLWNVVERLRPDCTFIYSTHDIDFASSRIGNHCVWVKGYNPTEQTWDYEVLSPDAAFSDQLYVELLGSRKPVLFIEGDSTHSIDSKLYPLVFPEYTVKPLGSCDRVITSVRTFNDLAAFHQLDSYGIVDRDRRAEQEIAYLRKKKILVPEVAEIENILMLPGVIAVVAESENRKAAVVVEKVKRSVIAQFHTELRAQALQHVRYRVKRMVEYRIDCKFRNIGQLEQHMEDLVNEINPRGVYESLCREFNKYVQQCDYMEVLKVFNNKPMLSESNVAGLCGLQGKNAYINRVLDLLKEDGKYAERLRIAIRKCFGL